MLAQLYTLFTIIDTSYIIHILLVHLVQSPFRLYQEFAYYTRMVEIHGDQSIGIPTTILIILSSSFRKGKTFRSLYIAKAQVSTCNNCLRASRIQIAPEIHGIIRK